ncbi:acyltransferase family protein [Rhizorhabdus argentea]|uniref:acyltransferase family protein n=1 Tax=Rhizorhabdus argentea TaxID=1387174 RepID=UPI0030ED8729
MIATTRRLVPSDSSHFGHNNFDAIRLAMALLVVFSHSYALRFGSEEREPLSIVTNGYYNSGEIGVWVFFIISGFLIARSHERSASNRAFMIKRVRRIYPGYLAATTICAFVITPLFAPGFAIGSGEVARTIGGNLLLANHFPLPALFTANPGPAINGSLWSIKYEFLCYLGVLMLGILARPVQRLALPLIYAAILVIWCWLDLSGRRPGGAELVRAAIGWPYLWFQILPNFLAGMIGYLYRDSIPRSTPLLGAGVIACFMAFHLGGRGSIGIVAAHLLTPPVLAYLVLWLAFHPAIALSGAARYGDFSYGTYLYAFVIQQMLIATLDLPFPMFVLLSLILALSAGVVSWWLVERHFLKRGIRPTGRLAVKEKAPAHS